MKDKCFASCIAISSNKISENSVSFNSTIAVLFMYNFLNRLSFGVKLSLNESKIAENSILPLPPQIISSSLAQKQFSSNSFGGHFAFVLIMITIVTMKNDIQLIAVN